MEDDDFVDVVPAKVLRASLSSSQVTVTHALVGKTRASKLVVSLPLSAYSAMGMDTPRVTVAYSQKKAALRVTHLVNGPYEVVDAPPGRASANSVVRPRRKMLRLETPAGVKPPAGASRDCRHEVVGQALLVYLPADWYPTYSSLAPVPAAPRAPVEPADDVGYGPERVKSRPVAQVIHEPGMPPPGRSALDQGARPGGGLVSPPSQSDPASRRLVTTRR